MARSANNHTIDELISVRITRQVTDDDAVAQRIAMSPVLVGYLLFELIHFVSGLGHSPAHRPGAGLYYFVNEATVAQSDQPRGAPAARRPLAVQCINAPHGIHWRALDFLQSGHCPNTDPN